MNNNFLVNGKLPKPIRNHLGEKTVIDLVIADENPQSSVIKNIEIKKSQLTDPIDKIILNDPGRSIDLVFAERVMQAVATTIEKYKGQK